MSSPRWHEPNRKMTEVSSLLSPSPVGGDSNVLAVKAYRGLHLEPPTRDLVSWNSAHHNKQNIYFEFSAASTFARCGVAAWLHSDSDSDRVQWNCFTCYSGCCWLFRFSHSRLANKSFKQHLNVICLTWKCAVCTYSATFSHCVRPATVYCLNKILYYYYDCRLRLRM